MDSETSRVRWKYVIKAKKTYSFKMSEVRILFFLQYKPHRVRNRQVKMRDYFNQKPNYSAQNRIYKNLS